MNLLAKGRQGGGTLCGDPSENRDRRAPEEPGDRCAHSAWKVL